MSEPTIDPPCPNEFPWKQAPAGWQPIASAPRDGTKVWVLIRESSNNIFMGQHRVPAMWNTMERAWYNPYTKQPAWSYHGYIATADAWHPFHEPELPEETVTYG